jgi:hypothetical protein
VGTGRVQNGPAGVEPMGELSGETEEWLPFHTGEVGIALPIHVILRTPELAWESFSGDCAIFGDQGRCFTLCLPQPLC